MTMFAAPNTSASKFDELMPALLGEPGATSVFEPSVHQHPIPRVIFDARLRLRYGLNGTVDYATSISEGTKSLTLDQSSAVFAANGPERSKSQAYSARVDELRHIASQDGYHLEPASESDFWRFVNSAPRWRKGGLVLMDNGNLRAVWKDGRGNRLGLQFIGSGMVQHVIFRQRDATLPVSRVAGRDTLDGICRQVEAFDLGSLLYK